MSYQESMQPCALYASRGEAEKAVAQLAEKQIDARIGDPDARTHGLTPGTCQVSVPGSQLARARAILNAA